ncbi:YbaB/EbfC family nucleoid-associated protein [Catellatospora paridis]|uniref:YbaB/EbfC family nucleoid-associated protein n=1 Tax=Catellatospora paridis TaxID=1617086 RepID=UPI0012D43A08|nr:YbaB/EbfC family nucleoid-associated protein [Catellatospora paridis]
MAGLFDGSLEDAERRIDRWEMSLEQRAANARLLAERLHDLQVTAEVADGAVKATVDTAGRLVALKLGDAVKAWSPEKIAAGVLAATGRASVLATAEIARIRAEVTDGR